jgi:hypothetical protein
MLDLSSKRLAVFVETGSSKWIFVSAFTCAAVVVYFFKKNPSEYTMISFGQCRFSPLFLFAGVFVCRHNLKTVALYTPNNVAVLSQMLQPNARQSSILFQSRKLFHFPIRSHGLSLNTNTNALARTLHSVNKRKKTSSTANLSSFNVANTNKFYSSISYGFHYFSPMHVTV